MAVLVESSCMVRSLCAAVQDTNTMWSAATITSGALYSQIRDKNHYVSVACSTLNLMVLFGRPSCAL